MKDRYKAKMCVYLVLIRNRCAQLLTTEVLLYKRNVATDFHPNEYALPSGHVEEGESLMSALIRESIEEVNVIPVAPRLSHVLYRQESEMGFAAADFFFVSHGYTGEINNNEPDKCIELTWCSINNLPPKTTPYIKHVLNCIKNGITFSEYGWSDDNP